MSKRIGVFLFTVVVFILMIVPVIGCSPPDELFQTKSEEENGALEAEKLELPGGPHQYPYPEGLVLPQVFIMSKDYYDQADLDALQGNVVEPLVAHFDSEGQTVVSIFIDNDNREGAEKNYFLIEVIISKNDGSNEPIELEFMHYKVDGQIPEWEMIDIME
ncbi:MAG: hypothetical protein GX364_03410 [Firmicutes bacterium]|nr:hypothetical protein [Bacillota bacterium]